MNFKDKVIDKFKSILDPELMQDVWTLKLIVDLEVNEETKDISFKFRPTVPTCPIGIQLAIDIKMAIKHVEGINNINMIVIDFYMADDANEILRSI